MVSIAFGLFDYRIGSREQLWIAGGIGITPFRSWIRAFPTEQPLDFDIDLYYTVRTEDEALFLDEITMAATQTHLSGRTSSTPSATGPSP